MQAARQELLQRARRVSYGAVEWEKAGSRVDIRVLSEGKREATNLQLRELQRYGHPLMA